MHAKILGIMATQHGLVTRQQAIAAGLLARDIDRLVRGGVWALVRRGVYADAELVAAATTVAARQQLRDRAACLRITVPFVRSHETAALELGLGLLLPPGRTTHVTRPCVGSHLRWGVKHHLAPYRDDDVVEVNGFRVLGPARTAVDIAREHGSPYGEVAIDRVRWNGTSLAELEDVLDRMRSWPCRRRAITCLEQSDAGAETVPETLMRLLLEEIGLGPIQTQFGMRDDRREAWADARVGRHLFEFDGHVKYQRPDGSRRLLTPEDILFEEKNREDWFRGHRLGMSRLIWTDVWGPGREAAKTRIRREYDATTALWGTSIEDLAPYIIRERRRAA
jgi:hypothetical protein